MASVADPTSVVTDRSAGHRKNAAPIQPVQASHLASQLARAVLVVVFSGICLLAFLRIAWFLAERPIDLVLAGVYMVALLGLQVFYFGRPNQRPQPPWSYLALLAEALLVYLPMFQFKQAWVSLPGFLGPGAGQGRGERRGRQRPER